MVIEGLLEFLDDLVAQRGTGIDGHQIIIVQVDTVCSQLRQFFNNLGGCYRRPHCIAKRIATPVPNSPESKGEPIFGFWLILICHKPPS